jgi:hypothetical protein
VNSARAEGRPSPPDLLVLHAVRVMGMADPASVARRTGVAVEVVTEQLLDDQARGWVRHVAFADLAGWTLTESGRAEGERRLAAELDHTGTREAVDAAHRTFLRQNARFLSTVTRWQLRPVPGDPLAANTHEDPEWDGIVLDELADHGRRLESVGAALAGALERFAGYDARYAAALERADAGQLAWVDAPGIESCHTVWIQLHEDLMATLGVERGSQA